MIICEDTRARLHKWAMQHIRDEKGYPEIESLFKRLETHEKTHNNFVSTLLTTINDEIKSILEAFPNLKEHRKDPENFYNVNHLLYALHNPNSPLNIVEDKELCVDSDRTIAKSDNQTVLNLKGEIEKIRLSHKIDFEKVEAGIDEDERIIDSIKSHVEQVIYDLSLEKPLKGKCDYELNLISK